MFWSWPAVSPRYACILINILSVYQNGSKPDHSFTVSLISGSQVCPPDQQHYHHLELLIRNAKSQALPRPSESKTKDKIHQSVFASSPGYSEVHLSLRTTNLHLRVTEWSLPISINFFYYRVKFCPSFLGNRSNQLKKEKLEIGILVLSGLHFSGMR